MHVSRFVFGAAFVGLMYGAPVLVAQDLARADSVQAAEPERGPTPSGATTRSVLWTVLPSATLVLAPVALVVGPSTGYFYGGMPGRAWWGIALRTIGLGVMIGAFGVCGWDCGPGDSGYNAAWAMFLGGGGIVVGSAIYDMAAVSGAVRKRQRAQAFVLPPTSSGMPVRFGIAVQF